MQIKRDDYLNKLIRKKENGLIKVITGTRRSGKSYLLFELFEKHLEDSGVSKDHIIEVDLENRLNKELRDPDRMLHYVKDITDRDEGMYYVLLDEVQYMKEFEDVLNSFLHFKNVDVYVTGSNSKFLSSDIITEFRGRGDEVRVYPLSFKEYSAAYSGTVEEAWDTYIRYGGLPYTLSLETDEEKAEYLFSLFEKVYLTDILDRHRIRNKEEMDELLDILSSAIGSYTNPAKLSRVFKSEKHKVISDATVKKYISYLEDAFLIAKAKRYDIKSKKYINSPAKYYFEDIGLRNARINFRQIEETHIMENIFFNELRIRGFKVDVGMIEKYQKDEEDKTNRIYYEVDFVANKGSQRIYIQSAYAIPTHEKEDQEIRSLRTIPDLFRKMVVVKDNIKLRRNEEGIEAIGLMEFLLNEWE